MIRLGLVILLIASVASANTYYVSPGGSDSNPGTVLLPFVTLEKARQTAVVGDTVLVRSGTYFLTNTLAITATSSGVTFRNYTNEAPTLVGGLPLSHFTTWQTNILVTDVSTQGFGNHFTQLIFNGARQRLARYPNYNGIGTNSYNFVAGGGGGSTTQFGYNAGDLHTYAHPTELQVDIFPVYSFSHATVSSIDTTNHVVHCGTIAPPAEKARYFIQNALEELDSAGEWYLDATNRYLYFWPPSAIGSATVYAPIVTDMITVGAGTTNLTIEGFTITCCEGHAIKLTSTTNCLVVKNTISATGGYSASGIFLGAGFTNGIVGNDIVYSGAYGIWMYGGTTATLVPGNNYVENNYIYNCGSLAKDASGSAIFCADPNNWANNSGNRVSHNQISHGPRYGIFFYGTKLQIYGNEIHDVMAETVDGGAIYGSSLNWTGGWGTRIAENYIHDDFGFGFVYYKLSPYEPAWGGSGIYLDFLVHGVLVESNIIARCGYAGAQINGGSENIIRNNTFYQIHPPSNGSQYSTATQIYGFTISDSTFQTYSNSMYTTWAGLNQSTWDFPGFSVSPASFTNSITFSNSIAGNVVYDTNATYRACVAAFNFPNPVQNTINSNDYYYATGYYGYPPVWINGGPYDFGADWKGTYGFDLNTITNDPLLNPDFSLATNSPALALGFSSFSTNGMGIYQDNLRASWPPQWEIPIIPPPAPAPAPASHITVGTATFYK